MGGVVSSGSTNSELVDNLVHAEILKSSEVEKVFRAVDRGVYYLPKYRDEAYKDRAWKHKNLHLSAPCIYGEVMEALDLKEGLSFLNLGSGTGYLSTMAGLILGIYGINHGVEFYQDVVDYSETQLKEFILSNEFFDAFEFCPPVFHCGNCLNLPPTTMKYDRVYCGAACSPEKEDYMKSLVNIGGLLVMPLRDQLVKIKRVTESKWEREVIMAVSFADLIPLAEDSKHLIELSEPSILSLQEVCRLSIRRVLRQNTEYENPKTKLFVLQSNKKNKKVKNNQQRSLDGDDICEIPSSLGGTSDQNAFIRVSFLPSGGRFMFIRSFSDNDEDETNESGFGMDGDNDIHQYNDDIHDHSESDNESSDPEIEHECQSVNNEISNHCEPNSDVGTSKHDSPITAKINAVSLDKNAFESDCSIQSKNQANGKETLDETDKVDEQNCLKISKCNNVSSSSDCSSNCSDDLSSRSRVFKRQKISQDVEEYPDTKPSLIKNLFPSGSEFESNPILNMDCENSSQRSSNDHKECANYGDLPEKTLLSEGEGSQEKSKIISCHLSDGDAGHLMSVSSGIGTHESLEMDDITGFESSCDQQELQTNSSLSSSSPSSLSLSPPHSKSSNQLNLNDVHLTTQPSTSNGGSKGDLSPDKDEENIESDDAIEPDVELLDYRRHMKDKICSLPIPFMLKKFLLYDRA